MRLNIAERLHILALLPQKGNILQLRLVQDAISLIGLSPMEIDLWGVRREEGKDVIRWETNAETTKEVDVPRAIRTLVAERLESLSKAGELGRDQIGLWEKFIEQKE